VAVQRHPLDAEFAAESAHGERAQALVVEELQGGVDDLGPLQWRMPHTVESRRLVYNVNTRVLTFVFTR
jgi:hypothetical protein